MKTTNMIRHCLVSLCFYLMAAGMAQAQWQTSGSNIYYNSGNVGIGTTNVHNYQSWNRVLDIFGTSNAKLLVRSTNIQTGIFSNETWFGTVGRIGTESVHDLRLMAGYGKDVMTLKTNGNVGVGTINPSATLDVLGINGTINSRNFRVLYPGGTLTNTEFSALTSIPSLLGGNGWTALYAKQGSAMKAGVFDGDVVMIGNVGIGTTNPTHKLDVRGTIRANEILVNSAGADFVFAPDYHLRPLTEVEQFITANKHLPDIAPADSMVQNGVNMGEMQVKLLQKIEELTLYVIEQEKRAKSLEQKIEELERQIENK